MCLKIAFVTSDHINIKYLPLPYDRSICVKSQIGSSMPQLMQLQQGLTSCGILDAIRKCPNLWALAFVQGFCKLQSPDDFLDELEVKYSQSQLLKDKEIDVFKYFCEFVQSLGSSDDIESCSNLICFNYFCTFGRQHYCDVFSQLVSQ